MESLLGCEIEGYVGGHPGSEQAAAIEKLAFGTGSREQTKKTQKKAKTGVKFKDWNKISPYITYNDKFVTRLALILTRGEFVLRGCSC